MAKTSVVDKMLADVDAQIQKLADLREAIVKAAAVVGVAEAAPKRERKPRRKRAGLPATEQE